MNQSGVKYEHQRRIVKSETQIKKEMLYRIEHVCPPHQTNQMALVPEINPTLQVFFHAIPVPVSCHALYQVHRDMSLDHSAHAASQTRGSSYAIHRMLYRKYT